MLSIGARVKHPTFGEGIITGEGSGTWLIFFREGDQEISKSFDNYEVLELGLSQEEDEPLTLDLVEEALRNVFVGHSDIQHMADLGERWEGGTVTLKPRNPDLQSKEIPLETFWHKIVMMRDRLRVLEQNINSHKVLSDQDKINLQQYITRCYGSMTTFNILFADKEEQFSSK
ncbi:MAG: hypothetical protein AAF487_10545 [Bacteroidota bacterium]